MAVHGDIMLRVEHLTMRFGGLVAVDDLSFTARAGDITALIGPNGAGKTTVFNCITGFYRPSEGRLALCHGDITAWGWLEELTDSGKRSLVRSGRELHLLERMPDFIVTQHARVARTFQNIRLFPGMTVLENLLVAQHNRLMLASGYTLLGILGFPSFAAAERAAIERARERTSANPVNPRESADAASNILRELWLDTRRRAVELGAAAPPTEAEPPFDPEAYAAVYRHLLRRRRAITLRMDVELEQSASVYDLAVEVNDMIPTAVEAAGIITRLERDQTTAEIEADVARWFDSI